MTGALASQIQPWTMQSTARALMACFVQEAALLLGAQHWPGQSTSLTRSVDTRDTALQTTSLHDLMLNCVLTGTRKVQETVLALQWSLSLQACGTCFQE